jgi:hypothetical protein
MDSEPLFVGDVERLVLRALTDRPEDAMAVLEIVEWELKRRKTNGASADDIDRMNGLRLQLQQALAPRRRPS